MTTKEKLNYNDLLEKFNKKTDAEIADAFTTACYSFNFELIKFFIKFPRLKEIKGVYEAENYAYKWACIGNRLEIMDYMVASPELNKHADIRFQSDFWFKNALKEKAYDVIHHFLFNLNVKKTEDMMSALKEYPDTQVEYWLGLCELNRNLNKTLIININKDKKIKL